MSTIPSALPQFSKINHASIIFELENILAKNRAELLCLLTELTPLDWGLIEQLDNLNDCLQRFWSPINHLHAVKQTPQLRQVYSKCLPLLSAYNTELMQNKSLYQAIKALANSNYHFESAQEKCLHNELRDFHLSGVDLPEKKQKRYQTIQTRLSQLSNQFEENLLDATANWSKLIKDKTELSGLPNHVLSSFKKAAQMKGLTGYLLSLDYPSYLPVLTHADNRSLRETLYKAHNTRTSELSNPKYDNSPVLLEILNLRYELSQLLGFSNYAQKSLASNKMAKNTGEVISFLEKLSLAAKPKAKMEWNTLIEFAFSHDNNENVQPWDILYYREKLYEKNFGISEDILRYYFPVEKVIKGLFNLIYKLFGMHVQEIKNIDIWHPDVRFFSITDEQQQLRGEFYLDLFTRPGKREGAWMDDYQSRRKLNDGNIQTPIAFLTCNFSSPLTSNTEALLTHQEVLTLFHEFGHGLQHMLTVVNYEGVSGINGVAWDAVEVPSQFLEYFAWEKPVLDMISCHYQSGEKLPDNLFRKMRATRNFQSGLQLLRQLELALFDFRLHTEFDPAKGYPQIQSLIDRIRQQINITPTASFNRFQHGFSHIFAGGYAAGYYSYLWAEVLSCDAFYKFLEEGIFKETTGQKFLKTILEQGGSKDALEIFKEFRGRNPKIEPFLESLGIK